ncbi:shikimate dehydrogenase [Mangrovicoccus algicola]|uniref:Shikimate dehydrogenase (NADP(+)) n=1 Tax=Mangrovicoccus algicola TaxID=2771008 RepID=A0A8J6YXG2_9RHOB|nr:shikimate dehydrogenase [Mangrovicoccus algicola]MBE3639572.1 shikimate dehydrogenase [Mangrovicoccus algicola]
MTKPAPAAVFGRDTSLALGLIGRGIQKSRTPAMHEAEAARQGLRCVYKLLDADRMPGAPSLAEMLRAAELCGFAGCNITFPYKIEVAALLDELDDSAAAVGAVNTVVFRDGRRIGYNTDYSGYAEAFRRGMDGAPRQRVLLIGSGGAGVAVAHALADCDVARLVLVDADPARARSLADLLGRTRPGLRTEIRATVEEAAADGLDGVVNCTPMGMAKLPGSAFPAALLGPRMWVSDIVYFPLETQLLAEARAAGCRVLPGAGMAVWQAVRAFGHFTGRAADPAAMEATFRALGDA